MKTLDKLGIGKTGEIISVGGKGHTRQHFLDMGLIPGSKITLVKFAPMGDPIEFKIHDYSLTLRKDDAKTITIKETLDTSEEITKDERIATEHPGLGEFGKYHDKTTENKLDDSVVLNFALVGNQNSGKTTLFNQLTGSNQHVGNFPGVTVDRKDGVIKNHPNTLVTDLPGIYSMSSYTSEEQVTRDFILDEKPKGIINIVDATTIERGLYLTMQLLELNTPMVLALNMMDEVRNNNGYIDINSLEKALGIPVVAISAAKNEGIHELIEHAVHVAKYQEKPTLQDYCDVNEHGGSIHRCLHAIMHLIEDHARDYEVPLRFAASKLAEGDSLIEKRLKLDKNEKDTLKHIVEQMEKERGIDRAAAIADMRYDFILKLTNAYVKKPDESIEHKRSVSIDKILTGKYTSLPFFILIIGLVFFLSFELIGPFLQNIIAKGIDSLALFVSDLMIKGNVTQGIQSLVINGIFKGVGTVVSFLPIIITLFFFLSILEDSGYMARIAFVSDKLLRKIGLSGRSIVPMLVGFGCTVPGVLSARTLPSARDRKMTILLTSFMSCTAKLPIYVFITGLFFPDHKVLIMIGLYLFGILMSIIVAIILKNTAFKGEAVPFVMELPNYRLPSARNVGQLLWEKAKDFLQRAFTVIFIATIIIWFLQNFSFSLTLVNQENSILASIASFITPVFTLCGFADWRIVVALITGFLAKESVVSTIEILFTTTAITSVLTPLSAMSLLLFCLLYTPCIAAIATIKNELGGKYAWIVVGLQCGIALVISSLFYTIASLFI